MVRQLIQGITWVLLSGSLNKAVNQARFKTLKNCKMKIVYAVLLLLFSVQLSAQEAIQVKKIWDKANHNSFPDLFKYKKYYYITFREGTNHVGNENDGTVRVMRSKNMKDWQTVNIFELNGVDVREARLSEMPDGRLLVTLAAGVWKDNQYTFLKPYVSFSDKKGENFSPLELAEVDPAIKPEIDWIWRVTWHKGVGYGILYQSFPGHRGGEWMAHLVKTTDGKKYERVVQLDVKGKPNECTIRFDKDGKMYVMVRREGDDKMGYLGVSNFPYKEWNYNTLSWMLGGPNFLFLNDGELIMGSRFHEDKKARTAIFLTDLQGRVKNKIILPSGGDNSYPGLLVQKKTLWVVYYSSHEGKSAIYTAQVPLSEFKKN